MTLFPAHTATALRGGPVLRWGVLAPGGIARDWVRTVLTNTDQRVVAVGSRNAERARAFADEFSIERSYGSYEALVADPGVDVVYIAAPHSEHLRLALLAISAGKPVLIEKPIGVSASEAREIASAARAAGVFAMEAMWSRFLPQTTVIRRLIDDGVLGDVCSVIADFSAHFDDDPSGRAFNPQLGGGALLDVGVYPLWFSHFVLGAPEIVTATGTLAATGVDAQAAVILDHTGGAQSVLTTSMLASGTVAAAVNGSLARIEISTPFIAPTSFRVLSDDGDSSVWNEPHGFSWRDGLCYPATAVAQHIADGLLESPLHSLDDSIAVLEVIDEARRQLGAN